MKFSKYFLNSVLFSLRICVCYQQKPPESHIEILKYTECMVQKLHVLQNPYIDYTSPVLLAQCRPCYIWYTSLTESSKSPAGVAKSNKQGTYLIRLKNEDKKINNLWNTNKQTAIKVIIMYKFVKIEIANSPHESYDKSRWNNMLWSYKKKIYNLLWG